MSNGLPPFEPMHIDSDKEWLDLCSAQDRLSYMRAKAAFDASANPGDPGTAFEGDGATDVAEARPEIAVAAATVARDEAENAFNRVRFALWTRLADEG